MSNLVQLIKDQEKRLHLVELLVRESVNGWQAIAKYRTSLTGPWGVGCDTDMVAALEKALIAGEKELTLDRDQGVTHYTDDMVRAIIEKTSEYEDLF